VCCLWTARSQGLPSWGLKGTVSCFWSICGTCELVLDLMCVYFIGGRDVQ
jgi:hypothetical protein